MAGGKLGAAVLRVNLAQNGHSTARSAPGMMRGCPPEGGHAMAAHGTFYWNELMSRDAEKAKAFYAATIGWTFDGMPMPDGDGGTYWIAKMNGKPVAGILAMGANFQGPPTDTWFAYLAVDD